MYAKLSQYYFSLLCWFRRKEVGCRELRKDNQRECYTERSLVQERIRNLRSAAQPILETRLEIIREPELGSRDEDSHMTPPAALPHSPVIAHRASDRLSGK